MQVIDDIFKDAITIVTFFKRNTAPRTILQEERKARGISRGLEMYVPTR